MTYASGMRPGLGHWVIAPGRCRLPPLEARLFVSLRSLDGTPGLRLCPHIVNGRVLGLGSPLPGDARKRTASWRFHSEARETPQPSMGKRLNA